jgi:cell division protein FtsL
MSDKPNKDELGCAIVVMLVLMIIIIFVAFKWINSDDTTTTYTNTPKIEEKQATNNEIMEELKKIEGAIHEP